MVYPQLKQSVGCSSYQKVDPWSSHRLQGGLWLTGKARGFVLLANLTGTSAATLCFTYWRVEKANMKVLLSLQEQGFERPGDGRKAGLYLWKSIAGILSTKAANTLSPWGVLPGGGVVSTLEPVLQGCPEPLWKIMCERKIKSILLLFLGCVVTFPLSLTSYQSAISELVEGSKEKARRLQPWAWEWSGSLFVNCDWYSLVVMKSI